MKLRPVLGVSWLLGSAAWAADLEPVGPLATAPTVAPVTPPAATPTPAGAPAAAPQPRKLLDLRIGDIREYMTPDEYRALLDGRDEERNTVIVQADAPLLPMKSDHDIPGGIMTPFWALANPHKIWRLVLPDPRIDIRKIPPPETAVPPPVFRWGP